MITIFKKPKIYRFYKDENGWFIDLKWFPLNKGYLVMIGGADIFLDFLSKNENEIYLKISSKYFPYFTGKITESLINRNWFFKLKFGTFYKKFIKPRRKIGYEQEIYLCPVTILIFGWYPKTIFYKIIKPLQFSKIKVGMRIKWNGDICIINEIIDIHNIIVTFKNGSGIICLDNTCEKFDKIYKY
jgi:hypothetical protein